MEDFRVPPAGVFPPDQDLAPDDVTIAVVVGPEHGANDVKQIVRHVRQAYRDPCDVIAMAVPAGKGMAFLEGLKQALETSGQLLAEKGLDHTDQEDTDAG